MLEALRGLIAWTPMGLPAFLFVITLVLNLIALTVVRRYREAYE